MNAFVFTSQSDSYANTYRAKDSLPTKKLKIAKKKEAVEK